MAAVIELHTGRALQGERHPSADADRGAPRLRVIHGGRSARARSMRRTFLARRALVLVGAVAVLWIGVQTVGAAFSPMGAAAAPAAVPSAVHTIEPGDTLWALATAVDPDADPRDVVDRIIDLNRGSAAVTDAGGLRAGEQLRLPVG